MLQILQPCFYYLFNQLNCEFDFCESKLKAFRNEEKESRAKLPLTTGFCNSNLNAEM